MNKVNDALMTNFSIRSSFIGLTGAVFSACKKENKGGTRQYIIFTSIMMSSRLA